MAAHIAAYESPAILATEIHSDTEAYLSEVLELQADGMVLRTSPAETTEGRSLWLQIAVGQSRPVRVLATVVARDAQRTTVKLKHVWPRDRSEYAALTHAF